LCDDVVYIIEATAQVVGLMFNQQSMRAYSGGRPSFFFYFTPFVISRDFPAAVAIKERR
jgi:hypothetical protein